jgi:3',5'-cyclic AMP phosphodiesterase CpdA
MLIAQITDLHVVEHNEKAYGGRVDSNALLKGAVDRLNRLSPQPDLIIATGDLADHGRPEEYHKLRELLAEVKAPIAVVIGNHDKREIFREELGHFEYLPKSGFLHYVLETRPVRVIVLDSTSDHRHDGDFCDERAAWLEARLSEADSVPTVVALHHPPFDTGIKWMDGQGSGWAKPLIEVIARYPNIVRVICGHLHRPIFTEVAGCTVTVAPSTAHQVALDLSPDFDIATQLPEFELEPPGFQLHSWDGTRLRTHSLHVQEWERIEPVTREMLAKLMASHQTDEKTFAF